MSIGVRAFVGPCATFLLLIPMVSPIALSQGTAVAHAKVQWTSLVPPENRTLFVNAFGTAKAMMDVWFRWEGPIACAPGPNGLRVKILLETDEIPPWASVALEPPEANDVFFGPFLPVYGNGTQWERKAGPGFVAHWDPNLTVPDTTLEYRVIGWLSNNQTGCTGPAGFTTRFEGETINVTSLARFEPPRTSTSSPTPAVTTSWAVLVLIVWLAGRRRGNRQPRANG